MIIQRVVSKVLKDEMIYVTAATYSTTRREISSERKKKKKKKKQPNITSFFGLNLTCH